ncbi:hypothetical protein WJX73_007143 [Symbiochloris irregularis]|uniref:Uncharacterized protein n=1 Tax=Symbiochloris irregularis TaxID=706552 RepID=A0AAW1PZE2_9CHLO
MAATGNNPYSMMLVTDNPGGDWQKGDVLIGNWNDANNVNFGQGNLLTLVRNGANVKQYTLSAQGNCATNFAGSGQSVGTGLGLTMAGAYLGRGYLMQCSLPIAIPSGSSPANNSNTASFPGQPGCCMIVNNQGKIVATYSGNGINGPWGMAVQSDNDGDNFYVWLSNVLGQQNNPNDSNKGTVIRYHFKLPHSDGNWKSSSGGNPGTIGQPTTLFSGFHSTPSGITGGTVGPAGLAFSQQSGCLVVMGTVSGTPAQAGKMYKICNAKQTGGGQRQDLKQCQGAPTPFKCGNGCNGPIGANFIAPGIFAQANGQDGCINAYNENGNLLGSVLIDGNPANGNPGQGNLFNLIAISQSSNNPSLLIVDDGQNAAFLNPAGSSSAGGRKLFDFMA